MGSWAVMRACPPWRKPGARAREHLAPLASCRRQRSGAIPISGSHLRSHLYPCINHYLNHHLDPYLKNIYIPNPVSASVTILYPRLNHHINLNACLNLNTCLDLKPRLNPFLYPFLSFSISILLPALTFSQEWFSVVAVNSYHAGPGWAAGNGGRPVGAQGHKAQLLEGLASAIAQLVGLIFLLTL